MSDKYKGMQTPDLLANTDSLLVVSERLKNVIQKYTQEHAEYLPVSIINHKGRIASDSYFIVNPIGTYACYDDKTVFSYARDGSGTVTGFEKLVFSAEKLKNVPAVFRKSIQANEIYIQGTDIFDDLKALQLTNTAGPRMEIAE